MPNGTQRDPLQESIDRLRRERANRMLAQIDPLTASMSRIMDERSPMVGSERGFISRAFDALTPETPQELAVIGAGLLDPIIGGVQALAELPGFFTTRELATDRAANFLERLNQGITSRAETAALKAGVPAEVIADSHMLGEILGYIAPVTASFKAARLLTGIRGGATSLSRNFILDTTAGAIFGGVLSPEENIQERVKDLATQSAVFGVTGLALNGLIFAWQGIRLNRARLKAGDADLAAEILAIENGGRVVGNEAQSGALVQLMNEEGYLANTPAAQQFMANLEFDNALVASIRGVAEAGMTRGIVEDFGTSFAQIAEKLPAMRTQFPGLKFDVVGRQIGKRRTWDLHFGMNGLSNLQKSQLKKQGRYTGQVISKGGTTYEYIRPGKKKGGLMVLTADGKITTIQERGVSNLPYAVEEIVLPPAGQALYADYRETTWARMTEAMGIEGPITEQAMIVGLRDGTLTLSDDIVRQFEIGGAITHPSELGITFAKLSNPEVLASSPAPSFSAFLDEAGDIWLGGVEGQQGHLNATIQMVMKRFGLNADEALQSIQQPPPELAEILSQLRLGRFEVKTKRFIAEVEGRMPLDPQDLIFASGADDFAARFLAGGKYAGDMTEPVAIRNMDDGFNVWAASRGLDLSAADIPAFRANFAQRYRNDMWDLVPDADLKVFQSIRDETIALAESRSTPAIRAGTKGMVIEELEGGRVALRDINTGARIEFGSLALADDAITNIIRSEKDPFGLFDPLGPHGMPGYTTGFDPTDGIFFFEEGKLVTVLERGANQITHQDFLTSTPTTGVRNRRDYFDAIERLTGVPLMSQGFGPIDFATIAASVRFEPFGRAIDKAWKGISRSERIATAEFWVSIEGSGLKGAQLVRAARAAGLNSKQISALTQSRSLYDIAARELGLDESTYIQTYYSRIRSSEGKTPDQIRALLEDNPVAIREFEFWARKQRTGELANLELDPVIVMNQYFRALFRELEVAPHEVRMAHMLELRIRDLPQAKQLDVLKKSLPNTDKNSFILPKEVRDVGTEYMINIQGNYTPGFESARRFTTRMFEKLGMKGDPQIFDQLINTWLSVQYGAALGLRFATMNRNAMQNMWTMYTRVGGEFGAEAHKLAMELAGYNQAVEAGAIRPVTASVAMGDAVFDGLMRQTPIIGTDPMSNALAASIRVGLRGGRVTRKWAEKFLIPYGSGDQINRAIAYHWQRLHTEKFLTQFNQKKINWDKFLEDGLPFFSNSIKQDFRAIFDKEGRERALQFIGKQAADEAHFIYGVSASPGWMQRPFGRLAGVFGQWPLWLSELYFRRRAHATPRQQIALGVRTLSLMGLVGNMGFQLGVDMWSWMAPTSLQFGGGPTLDTFVDLKALVDAPIDRKQAAAVRLGQQMGSLAFPGQLFYREIGDILDAGNVDQALTRLLLGRNVDQRNMAYDLGANPLTVPEPTPPPLGLSGLPSIGELIER